MTDFSFILPNLLYIMLYVQSNVKSPPPDTWQTTQEVILKQDQELLRTSTKVGKRQQEKPILSFPLSGKSQDDGNDSG